MTIPTNITVELASLEAQVTDAQPLANAGQATITALQLNAGNLVADIQTALTTTTLIPNIVLTTDSGWLDNWVPPIDALSMVGGVLNVLVSAQNQSQLSLMRGVVGRAASNLDQLV
jgi:hypothetical protein